MPYVVFAQASEEKLPLVALLQNARRFFDASIDVLEERDATTRLDVELVGRELSGRGRYAITAEPVTERLLERARRAEVAGRAAGMSALAERCRKVWRIEPEGEAPEVVTLMLAGILASVGLGPVLPDDDSTLFGVRGAKLRALKAQKA